MVVQNNHHNVRADDESAPILSHHVICKVCQSRILIHTFFYVISCVIATFCSILLHYAALIVQNNHPNLQDIISDFEDFVGLMSDKPQ